MASSRELNFATNYEGGECLRKKFTVQFINLMVKGPLGKLQSCHMPRHGKSHKLVRSPMVKIIQHRILPQQKKRFMNETGEKHIPFISCSKNFNCVFSFRLRYKNILATWEQKKRWSDTMISSSKFNKYTEMCVITFWLTWSQETYQSRFFRRFTDPHTSHGDHMKHWPIWILMVMISSSSQKGNLEWSARKTDSTKAL